MSRSALKANAKPWKKTDEDLLILKQGQITTYKSKQFYRLRVARWGKFQAVVQKRLFRYDKQLLDYIPGRSMGFNLQDMQIILQHKDEIFKILKQIKQNIDEEQVYKNKLIAQKNKENEVEEQFDNTSELQKRFQEQYGDKQINNLKGLTI